LTDTRYPLVRPPRGAQGGGAADAFASTSGAPGIVVPTPGSRRARMLAMQYADDERGRLTERIFKFPQFPGLSPGGPTAADSVATSTIQVQSNRSSFSRMVALRGVLQFSDTTPLTGLETANLQLRLQINGEEDLTTSGQVSGTASFAALFSEDSAPWLWFAAPPRLRAGDELQLTVTNVFPDVEGAPTLVPEVCVRLVDDEWWRILYGA
jgi:hypothetical protein